jgi:ABC-type sugar transport system ATPase subunit
VSSDQTTRTARLNGGAPDAGLRVSGLAKAFPGTQALAGVDLEIARGEIHALVGSNGSGKSTLIKVLAGVYQGDAGELEVEGERIAAKDVRPGWAPEAALGFVHQDLGLIESLTVAENLFLGMPYPRRGGRIDWRALNRAAEEMLARLEIEVGPGALLAGLRSSDRTLVAIGRAVRGRDELQSGTLVLDEPTAKLPATDVKALLQALRRYATRGQSILYVSHRLDEVLAFADRITVLRDGRVIALQATADFDYARLASLIAGRSLKGRGERSTQAVGSRGPSQARTPVLEVRDLHAGALSGIDLTVAPGEVVGLAGLVGSGRSSLLKAVFGALHRTRGEVLLAGRTLPPDDTSAAVEAGIGYVPEDRAAEGAFLRLNVRENLAASALPRNRARGALGIQAWLRLGAERCTCDEAIERFEVRCPGLDGEMALLSGGNQQKVVLARWLAGGTRLLLLDEPTQGVDVGARAEIYGHIKAAARQGLAAVVASSDTDELIALCDRVIVLAGGRVAAEARDEQITHHWLADHVYGRDYLEVARG